MGLLLRCSLVYAQNITVHVVDWKTGQSIKRVDIDYRDDCLSQKPPKGFSQKTNASGTTIFRNYKVTSTPFCLSTFSIAYASHTLDYIFMAPNLLGPKNLNPVVTSLPADITFKVKKRSLAEQLHFIFIGD